MDKIKVLQDKRIVLATTGSIAVYKAVDLASKLTQAGALVDVIMTDSAQRFVNPITFQAVTGRPVYTDMWQTDNSGGLPTHIAHVGLGEGADLIAVIPATANTIARLAQGMSDDLLTVTALSARCPMLIAPAMDGGMYEHPATQANIKTLVGRGVHLIEPEVGRFASGLVGRGRLPETNTHIGHIRRIVASNALRDRHVIVTAGPTREAFDPVRFISNHSSGKQGYAVAQAALDAGAAVTLISSVDLPIPIGANLIRFTSAQDLLNAVLQSITGDMYADALIMTAAVADFRPDQVAEQKIKKQGDDEGMTVALTRNPDILKTIHERRQQSNQISNLRVVVGFAAESENLLKNAKRKVENKGLDFIVANDISADDAGFAVDDNRVVFLHQDGTQEAFDLMRKSEVAEKIINRVSRLLL